MRLYSTGQAIRRVGRVDCTFGADPYTDIRERIRLIESSSSKRSATIGESTAPAPVTTDYDYVANILRNSVGPDGTPYMTNMCHYTRTLHDGDDTRPAFAVYMKGKNSSPKLRFVCTDCCLWMTGDFLVEKVMELRTQLVTTVIQRT